MGDSAKRPQRAVRELAREVDFGYYNDAAASLEITTRRRLAVRYIAARAKFPYLSNFYHREYVLVPTPQELRVCGDSLGERSAAVRMYCARLYRALRYVSADAEARVEVLTE